MINYFPEKFEEIAINNKRRKDLDARKKKGNDGEVTVFKNLIKIFENNREFLLDGMQTSKK
ncbi:hypothetical protein [Leptospira levettii]|uniref:Uncharacterized protein n=1 Tax=Leptospira levettii TaxID=2023178 RepID=A0AAW5VBC5_9LEPT|nr:hypothetical protein [Leptospira levettii]MCW7512092.1 hypothetical protein [Leptospira levettii]MCW7517169.1 hypothetical protein [Leptospira levettii]